MSLARGTSNGNVSGSAESRRRRKHWLLAEYRADVDLGLEGSFGNPIVHDFGPPVTVPLGLGVPACRCYRCGTLLTFDTVTVDRRIPGCEGGTYRRNNIRPACGSCNSITGNNVRWDRVRAAAGAQ